MPLRPATTEKPVLYRPAKRSGEAARSRVEALFKAPHADIPAAPRDLEQWERRRLRDSYAVVFFDSLAVRVRDDGQLCNRRIHLALGVLDDGSKDILAYWIEAPDADRFWPTAVAQLRARGITRLDFAVAEEEAAARALTAFFPHTQVYGSIRHAVRAGAETLPFAARAEAQKETLRFFETAPAGTPPQALAGLAAVRNNPALASYWRRHREAVAPVLTLPPALRRLLCSTSAVESVVEKRRRRGLAKRTNYPSAQAAVRTLLFVLRDAHTSWKVSPGIWAAARADVAASRVAPGAGRGEAPVCNQTVT